MNLQEICKKIRKCFRCGGLISKYFQNNICKICLRKEGKTKEEIAQFVKGYIPSPILRKIKKSLVRSRRDKNINEYGDIEHQRIVSFIREQRRRKEPYTI